LNGKDDIERIHKIDDVYVSSPIDLDSDLASKKVKGENKGVAYYAVDKDSRLERIFDTVLDIIAGKNKAGKGLGKVKDAVTWIVPALAPIDKLTDEIGDYIKSKRTNTIMENPTQKSKKPWYRSTTINSILSFITLLIVQVFDIDIVAADLQAVVVAIGMAVSAVVALYGRITATQEIGKD
jgi:hypothetical protein